LSKGLGAVVEVRSRG